MLLALVSFRTSCSEKRDKADEFRAVVYKGQSCLMKDQYDSACLYLKEGVAMWRQYGEELVVQGDNDRTPVYVMFNGLGIYFINKEMDYVKATEYLIEGLKLAVLWSSDNDYAVMAQNLVFTFFLRQNAEGLKYAMDVYQKGKGLHDGKMIFMGSYGCAMMYYLKKDYLLAEKFIEEAVSSSFVNMERAGVYNMYANILGKTGDSVRAEAMYKEAMACLDDAQITTVTYVYLSFGSWLLSQKRYQDAVAQLEAGLRLADEKGNKVFTWQMCRALSAAYEYTEQWRKAFEYQERYHSEADSVFNIDKERTINGLEMMYVEARHEADMHKKNKILLLCVAAAALVLIVSVILAVMYKNKDRMYTRIVRQYREAVTVGAELEKARQIIDELKGRLQNTAARSSTVVESGKSEEIFSRLEQMMRQDRIYKDPELSRDKIASMLGTNRTYVSKIVNDVCRKSVVQYINDYRIDHAIKMLSDPQNDFQIKEVEYESGFSVSATFFKLFKEKVGMSPSKYRQKVKETLSMSN